MPSHITPTDLLDPIEKASRDEITALQTQRLKATLDTCYQNVPHYRRAFDAAGVHPTDFKELADLAKFPFPTKKTCAPTTCLACLPCRNRKSCAFMHRQALPVNLPWWAAPPMTSVIGLIWWPGRLERRVGDGQEGELALPR